MKILKARWLRFWHCLFYTITDSGKPHQMVDMDYYKGDFTTDTLSVRCSCGKVFYENNDPLL